MNQISVIKHVLQTMSSRVSAPQAYIHTEQRVHQALHITEAIQTEEAAQTL